MTDQSFRAPWSVSGREQRSWQGFCSGVPKLLLDDTFLTGFFHTAAFGHLGIQAVL